MPAEVKRQTIKQAKKSYKVRGQPSLSEQEVKTLQRARELDQRAWGLREKEKRRAEAIKRRAEKTKEEQLERTRAQLGSQRRHDRFGYMSSQFHLGKFFQMGNRDVAGVPDEPKPEIEPELQPSEELSGDVIADKLSFADDLEESPGPDSCGGQPDATSMHQMAAEALPDNLASSHSPLVSQHDLLEADHSYPSPPIASANIVSIDSSSEPIAAEHDSVADVNVDLSNFWEDLGSNTQIARDLETPSLSSNRTAASRSSSFGLSDTDFTFEDLEVLEPPVEQRVQTDRTLMPPPLLPKHVPHGSPAKPTPAVRSPSQRRQVRALTASDNRQSCSSELGFTTSELERWVGDEVVLTQVVPD